MNEGVLQRRNVLAGVAGLAVPLPIQGALAQNLPACPGDQIEDWDSCDRVYLFANGDRYHGTFEAGRPNGVGTYVFVDNTTYSGEFREGLFNGAGTLIFPDGSRYVGQFANGAYEGQGTEYLPGGVRGRSGIWSNSRFVRTTDAVSYPAQPPGGRAYEVTLVKVGGVFRVPVLVNDITALNFLVDSGAADVNVPDSAVREMVRLGSLRREDFRGERVYRMANGQTMKAEIFLIARMRVGDWQVDEVLGSNGGADGLPLLGQTFLGRFRSWSINNARQSLVLE